MIDHEFVTSEKERGFAVINAQRVIFGNDRPSLVYAHPSGEETWGQKKWLEEFAKANRRIVAKTLRDLKGAPSVGTINLAIESEGTKTTIGVSAPDESGKRSVKLSHYTETFNGGIDTQTLEVVTIKPDGHTSIFSEIWSSGFDKVVNWSNSVPHGENLGELGVSDLRRARSLAMKVINKNKFERR